MGRRKKTQSNIGLDEELDCHILTPRLVNILVYNNNLALGVDRYEKSLELISKKYFRASFTDRRLSEEKKESISEKVHEKWHELIKKYAGFDVSVRKASQPELSRVLILERI